MDLANMRIQAAKVLPPDARALLIRAARVDPTTPFGESRQRKQWLDDATRRVKTLYPEYFRKEK
jgi:hypothetical protein